MQSIVKVDLDTMKMVEQAHTTSGTTEVNLETGDQQGFAFANMSRCVFTQQPNPMRAPPFGGVGAIFGASRGGAAFPTDFIQPPTATLVLSAEAGDPLVGMAADIDYTGIVTIVATAPGSVGVSFDGLIDDFPAYDCYANFGGATKTLFVNSPPKGNTVVDLLGPPRGRWPEASHFLEPPRCPLANAPALGAPQIASMHTIFTRPR
jgi:hypothetical protein